MVLASLFDNVDIIANLQWKIVLLRGAKVMRTDSIGDAAGWKWSPGHDPGEELLVSIPKPTNQIFPDSSPCPIPKCPTKPPNSTGLTNYEETVLRQRSSAALRRAEASVGASKVVRSRS